MQGLKWPRDDSRDIDEESLSIPSASAYRRGEALLEYGLDAAHSRNEAQFHVLYFYWRNNFDPGNAIRSTKAWIRNMHNGLSAQVDNNDWRRIDAEIERQANRIWTYYEKNGDLPNQASLWVDGWTTRDDLIEIALACDGRIRLSRFLYKLIRYCRPRMRYTDWVPVHVKRLVDFSSSASYLDLLDDLEQNGIITRSEGYLRGHHAKRIHPVWRTSSTDSPLLVDGRSPDTYDGAIASAFPGGGFEAKLRQAGAANRIIANLMRNLTKTSNAIQ